MSEDYRGEFLRLLESRAVMAGLRQGATVSQFIAALPKSSLLGVNLPEDVKNFLDCYTRANLEGGAKLEEFTANVTAQLSEDFFETRLAPEKDRPTVSDAIWLARNAVAVLGLTANGEEPPCVDLSKLPLAA